LISRQGNHKDSFKSKFEACPTLYTDARTVNVLNNVSYQQRNTENYSYLWIRLVFRGAA
jgi:hypothetical protein